MKSLLLSLLLYMATCANAQLMYNSGADIAVAGGGIMYVGGALENADGYLTNAGQTTIKGYFRNGSLADGGFSTGEYIVYGNWENNSIFNAHQSRVRLRGSNQLITGTQVTTFHQLHLENGGIKSQTLDAFVNHLLSLNYSELATNDYRMTVTNPAVASVTRISGFVSSTGPGRLIRNVNSTNEYLFPTGWNDTGQIYYRPVMIKPSISQPHAYEVRMAYGNATAEGYDINVKANNVLDVNKRYFHYIRQTGVNAPAELSIYYNPAQEAVWNSIGRWQNVPQWQDLTNVTTTQGSPLFYNKKTNWLDNGNEPHILINAKEAEYLYNFPNVFSPNADGTNDFFGIINQLDLVTLEELRIFNRWGEPVFDMQRDGKPDWDGYYQGKLQPMGNYVFMASIKVNDTGKIISETGNLSLIW